MLLQCGLKVLHAFKFIHTDLDNTENYIFVNKINWLHTYRKIYTNTEECIGILNLLPNELYKMYCINYAILSITSNTQQNKIKKLH